jgi:large-conductance mechanosensitive channel
MNPFWSDVFAWINSIWPFFMIAFVLFLVVRLSYLIWQLPKKWTEQANRDYVNQAGYIYEHLSYQSQMKAKAYLQKLLDEEKRDQS